MADTESRPTLCFNASFPLDADFASTAGELAIRLAEAGGIDEAAAQALGRSVEEAFGKALMDGQTGVASIDVALCAKETSVELTVSRGATALLELRLARPR
jgi:hypothetical protein